jgi:hypothetical protein
VRESGFSFHYEFVLVLESDFAETLSDWRSQAGVTSNLPLLSVLAGGLFLLFKRKSSVGLKEFKSV